MYFLLGEVESRRDGKVEVFGDFPFAGITGMSRFDVIDSVKIIILKRFAVVSSNKSLFVFGQGHTVYEKNCNTCVIKFFSDCTF